MRWPRCLGRLCVAAVVVIGVGVHSAEADAPAAKPTPAKAPAKPPADQAKSCPTGMVHVPAGSFVMGSPDSVGGDNEHPQHKVTLSGFCIDKTELTVAAFAKCAAAGGCSPIPTPWSGCNRNGQNHPVNCVIWSEAKTYCEWAGKRLPTEAEWEYAARGGDGRTYPWGNQDPDKSRLQWLADSTAPVGSFPAGASPFGALDMAGNVWEWTADGYGAYAADPQTNPTGASDSSSRVIRGAGWRAGGADDVRAANRGFGTVPTVRSNETGFRCVRGD
jgi:formylglycine-generating enzyme required for sulfatase activity